MSANVGAYHGDCRVCQRQNVMKLHVHARDQDWVVASLECVYCGVDSVEIVGERGRRAAALLKNRATVPTPLAAGVDAGGASNGGLWSQNADEDGSPAHDDALGELEDGAPA